MLPLDSSPRLTPRLGADLDGTADLAHVLTHRLGSLVSTIETYADLLVDGLEDPEHRSMAMSIFEATAHIERILSDTKRYAQVVTPVLQPVSLCTFARALPPFFGDDYAERLLLDVEVAPERTLAADPMLLRQAVMVLVQNALDAAPPPAPVVLRISFEDGHARLAVWNDGAIEKAEVAQKLFSPFFTTKAQNLGVGLPLARRIAEAHDGTLRLVTNDSARGTCFELLVPDRPAYQDGASLTLTRT